VSRAPAVAVAKPAAAAIIRSLPRGYFAQSALPLTSLVFVLPMLILYEVGTHRLAVDSALRTDGRIIAHNLMQDFFLWIGAHRSYLPALTVVGVLLCWHIARNDAWKVSPTVLIGMLFESLLLAFPLILLSMVFARYLPLAASTDSIVPNIVLNMGAGVYEELVFRLITFTLLSLLLIDILKIPRRYGTLLIVVFSAITFSLYHYLGNEAFQGRIFAFRIVAGLFFGATFLYRGYGVTAGAHAAYDIFITAFRTHA